MHILRRLNNFHSEPLRDEQLLEDKKTVQEYSKLMSERNNARMHDLQQKLTLKWAAVEALPTDELRMAALEVDSTPFPPYRQVYTWSPPIAGFDKTDYTNV